MFQREQHNVKGMHCARIKPRSQGGWQRRYGTAVWEIEKGGVNMNKKKLFRILAEAACAMSISSEGDSRYALLANL